MPATTTSDAPGVIGSGFADRCLTPDEIRQIVSTAAGALRIDGRRVLVIIPDGTRTMPMPLLFDILQQEIGATAAASAWCGCRRE